MVTLLDVLSGQDQRSSRPSAICTPPRPALVIGADLAQQHPLLTSDLRANWRHHRRARVLGHRRARYARTTTLSGRVALRGARLIRIGGRDHCARNLPKTEAVVILFGDAIKGDGLRKLVAFGRLARHPGEVRLPAGLRQLPRRGGHGSDSRTLPGYKPTVEAGSIWPRCCAAEARRAVGGGRQPAEARRDCVAEGFRRRAGSVPHRDCAAVPTSSCRRPPLTRRTARSPTSPARCNASSAATRSWAPRPISRSWASWRGRWGSSSASGSADTVFADIRQTVRGYNVPLPVIATGGAAQAMPVNGRIPVARRPDLVHSADTAVHLRLAGALF